MRRLWKKLHSESGASILLALLLFLVCCMVAATVLAAAASNAGKIRSNRAEQQKYLTLSSAIRLVADEIQKAEYTWKYTVYDWEVTESGSTQHYFYCKQENGTYKCGDLTEQLPLKESLEGELRKLFLLEDGTPKVGYKPLDNTEAKCEDDTTCNLLVTLPDDLDGYPYQVSSASAPVAAYQVPKEVTVSVYLNHNTHHITLTAWLGTTAVPPADKYDTMIAELVAKEETAPNLDEFNPAGWVGATGPGPGSHETNYDNTTMTWKLNWIKKGGS